MVTKQHHLDSERLAMFKELFALTLNETWTTESGSRAVEESCRAYTLRQPNSSSE